MWSGCSRLLCGNHRKQKPTNTNSDIKIIQPSNLPNDKEIAAKLIRKLNYTKIKAAESFVNKLYNIYYGTNELLPLLLTYTPRDWDDLTEDEQKRKLVERLLHEEKKQRFKFNGMDFELSSYTARKYITYKTENLNLEPSEIEKYVPNNNKFFTKSKLDEYVRWANILSREGRLDSLGPLWHRLMNIEHWKTSGAYDLSIWKEREEEEEKKKKKAGKKRKRKRRQERRRRQRDREEEIEERREKETEEARIG